MSASGMESLALMSIHPGYAEAILNGSKTVELRKRALREGTTHVVIYATSPVSALVGTFRVAGQITLPIDLLWDEIRSRAGVTREQFFSYYSGRDVGTAIETSDVHRLPDPPRLEEHLGIARPPQSFQYLAQDDVRRKSPLLAAGL